MTTSIQRAANALPSKYIVAWMHDGPDGGLVAFLDPHTLKPEWSGPKLFGIARFTRTELDSFTATQILHRVRDAEAQLLEDLRAYEAEERAALFTHAAKLSSFLCAAMIVTQVF